MGLDERKFKILKAIIRTYLETGEPVGSRTISKLAELNVSSATVRNEMSDLEELGLIVQPHTSAGRVPTDKGYRLYVDEMMEENRREVQGIREFYDRKMDRIENVLKYMAKMLAANTNYATMISGPRYRENEIKLVQLSLLDDSHLVVVLVVEGNVVKNRVIDIKGKIKNDELLKLNVLLNSALQGKTLNDISLQLVHDLKKESGDMVDIVGSVLEVIVETIQSGREEQPEVYTSGATNLFKYPELTEGETASEILGAFEEKNELLSLLNEQTDSGHNIQVYIGNEAPISSMRDCSVVTANYELGKGLRGSIGIIGPKRMDYEHVVGTLKTVMEQLDNIYNKDK